MNNEKTDMNS